MTKKRLSDLLREEVQDQETSQPAIAAPDPSAPIPNEESGALKQLQALVDTLKATLEQEKSAGEALKKQLNDLTATQESIRQQEEQQRNKALATAQQKIKTLEQQLKQEQNKVKTLQTETTKLQQLQTDLDAEKALVGELHSKIQALEVSQTKTSISLAPRLPMLPARYIAPGQPSSELTDDDIGWFD